nr:hypothetical protein [Tanacetum cinerariifolium]
MMSLELNNIEDKKKELNGFEVLLQAREKFFEIQHAQPEYTNELLRKLIEDLQIISEELAEYINSPSWNRPTFYNDDEEHSTQYKEYLENSSNIIAPVLPTKEPDNSLSMWDEYLRTIPKTELEEVIKSSVKNLVPIPSEFEVTSDNENTLIDSSPKFDYLLKLTHINPIPSGIKKGDFDLEEEIHLVENLLYDNSFPRPPKELNAEIANTIVESLSPYPIPVEDSNSLMEYLENSSNAITPVLPTEETDNSLSMGDEYLSIISETKSDEVIKFSVNNLVPIPSEFKVTSDNESECDVPVCDDFTTFSNPLFDCNDDFTSSDDGSRSNEDVLIKNFKIYSNSLFDDEEIISTKIDLHFFNAEFDLIESLINQDTLIDSSPKFDYLLELNHINPIPSRIEKADFDLEEEIRLVENLLYDNSFPRSPEELNVEIADTIIESLSPSPITVEDSNSLMEEIDLFLDTDDIMPPGIDNDDYDSKGDIHFLEELLSNDPLPLSKNESSNFDNHDDLSFPRPLLEPSDVEIFFD